MRRPLLGLAVLCSLAAGSFSSFSEAGTRPFGSAWALQQALGKDSTLRTPRPPGTSDVYAPARGCFALRSATTGKLVARAGSGAGFAATGTRGEPFRFQAFDLGKYLLLGSKRDFLATADQPLPTQEAGRLAKGYVHGYADNWETGLDEPVDTAVDTGMSAVEAATAPVTAQPRGDEVIAAAKPSASAEWVLKQVGRAFVLQQGYSDGDEAAAGPLDPPISATIVSSAAGVLTAASGAVTTRAAQFSLVKATGCRSFDDAPTGVQGPVRTGATPYEQTKGYLVAHLHLMAMEFLGGRVHCGRPWHPYGISYALADCPDHTATRGYGALVEDFVSGRSPGSGHDTTGYPSFPYWPRHDSLTHEQVYYQWLERAWRGGLRMMTDLLVDNGQLCEAYPLKKNSCNEMQTVRLEAQRSREFERFIDAQYGGPGRGWFRLVTDPLQARRVINAGKLAVVLGIEVSRPLDCRELQGQSTCTAAQIDQRLTEVRNLGVRQMEMTNKFDNALTGVTGDGGATGILVGGVGNLAETGHVWKMGTCEKPFGPVQHDHTQLNVVDDGHAEPARDGIFAAVLEASGRTGVAPLYPAGPHCNTIGLSSLGKAFLEGMIKRGMMFDPDHMSAVARQAALDIMARRGYSGVVSSHSWADDANYYEVLRLGGVVTPHAGASSGFLGKWGKLRQHADKRFFYGIGYGSDISGFSAQGGGRNPGAGKGVRYPFQGFGGTTIAQPRTGTRSWDINTDGVAQYGLYPDWVADVRVQAGSAAAAFTRDIEAGPEAYLQSWERAIGIAGDACRRDIRDLPPSALAAVRGKTPEQVLAALGQPHTRAGSTFTFCTIGGIKTVRFSSAGRVA
ncbi:MAG: peptidase [Mycobacteriales bacterium]